MANVNSLQFYGSPCDYDWYEDISTGTFHGDLECSVWFCSPKTFKNSQTVGGVTTRMFPECVVTNLECMSVSTYESENTNVLSDYVMAVATLIDCSFTDEIDSRGIENKIPSATFSFKIEGVDNTTSYSDVETILSKFDNKLVKIYRGYTSHTGSLRDENGRFALDYYSDYTHDMRCMGNYVVTKKEYNYDTNIFTFECESLFFHDFTDTEHYAALSMTDDATETAHLYQLYPYPYASTYRTEAATWSTRTETPLRSIDSHKLGYSVHEMLRSDTKHTFGTFNAPLYGCNFSNGEAYGVDTSHIMTWLWKDGSTQPSRYCYTSQANPVCAETAEYSDSVGTSSDIPYRLVGLLNNWKKETAIESVNVFNLINNLRILPFEEKYVPEESRTNNIIPGSWRTVGGYSPPKNPLTSYYHFLDEDASWSESTQGNNGGIFPALSHTYFVTPQMMFSTSAEREKLEWSDYANLDTYYVNFTADTTTDVSVLVNMKDDTYSVSTQATDSSLTDLAYNATQTTFMPYPTAYDSTGFASYMNVQLNDEYWWRSTDVSLIGNDGVGLVTYGSLYDQQGEAVGYKPLFPSAPNMMGDISLPIHDGYLDSFKFFWNTHLSLYSEQPFSFTLRYVIPTTTTYDINNSSVSESDNNGLTSIHFHPDITGLPHRVLSKANYSDALQMGTSAPVYTKPEYQVTWEQIDDPSLRVGTAVYVPYQNRYVRCYITKQERTFDGGARLKCTGIMFDNLGPYVKEFALTNASGYFVLTGDKELHIKWQTTQPFGSEWTFTFKLQYIESEGLQQVITLDTFELRGQGSGYYRYDNYDVTALEEEYGEALDYYGENGTFYIVGISPYTGTEYSVPVYLAGRDIESKKFSGSTRASNQQQPMMPDQYLLG